MANIPQFRGKKREIVERALRGETPGEIALALRTDPGYVYNVRSQAMKQGIVLPPILPPNVQNPPATGARDANQGPGQTQPGTPRPEPQNVNPDLPIIGQDNDDLHARNRELDRREQVLQLFVREKRVTALEEEHNLRLLIANIAPNPTKLLTSPSLYADAMSRILLTSPWRDRLNAVADVHWTTGSKLNEMVLQRSIDIVTNQSEVRPSETLVRDLVVDFITFAKNYEITRRLRPPPG